MGGGGTNAGISQSGQSYGYVGATANATTGISIQPTGAGQAVPIVPPALAVGFIIKT